MGLLAAIMLAVYLANPFGTASLDPRARLLGVALYKIPSRSMEPTLQQGDFILANAARYAFADPQVGDLVVFRFPPQRSIAYVKRIAGIPGDRVRIDGGRLYVNERPVTEPYLAQQALRQPDSLRMAERTVPAGQYFMLGDTRIDFTVDNLFNRSYRQPLGGDLVYSQGRNAKISVTQFF